MKEKICTQCTHYRYLMGYQVCGLHPQPSERDPVSGNLIINSAFSCENERTGGWIATRIFMLCGKEGRFFSPKFPSEYPELVMRQTD